jgi:hypothetical protein
MKPHEVNELASDPGQCPDVNAVLERPRRRARDAQSRLLAPTERQQRILRALADAQTPLASCDLRRRVCLSPTELRSACVWLQDHQYIAHGLRRVKRSLLGGSAYQVIAFWFVTEKGRAEVKSVAGTD